MSCILEIQRQPEATRTRTFIIRLKSTFNIIAIRIRIQRGRKDTCGHSNRGQARKFGTNKDSVIRGAADIDISGWRQGKSGGRGGWVGVAVRRWQIDDQVSDAEELPLSSENWKHRGTALISKARCLHFKLIRFGYGTKTSVPGIVILS